MKVKRILTVRSSKAEKPHSAASPAGRDDSTCPPRADQIRPSQRGLRSLTVIRGRSMARPRRAPTRGSSSQIRQSLIAEAKAEPEEDAETELLREAGQRIKDID